MINNGDNEDLFRSGRASTNERSCDFSIWRLSDKPDFQCKQSGGLDNFPSG
jgi:hypothetical protein